MWRKSGQRVEIDVFFTAERWTGDRRIMETKADAMNWFALLQLPDNLTPHCRRAIDDGQKLGISFSEFSLEEMKREPLYGLV